MALDLSMAGSVLSGIGAVGGLFGGSGGSLNRRKQASLQRMLNEENLQYQHNIARTMPTEIVKGANLAGIHPLVAFGSQVMSAQPNVVGNFNEPQQQGNWSTSFLQAGQDLTRAYQAQMSQKEREADKQNALQLQREQIDNQRARDRASAEHMGLQNDLIRTQIKRLEQQMNPPAPSSTDQSNVVITPYDPNKQSGKQVGKWELNPAPVTSADAQIQSLTAGPPSPAMKKYRLGGPNLGYMLEVPEGQSFSEGLESLGAIPSMGHTMAHQALRAVDNWWYGNPHSKPKVKLPAGYHWEWKPLNKVWRAERTKK